jgi:hypothetical protein
VRLQSDKASELVYWESNSAAEDRRHKNGKETLVPTIRCFTLAFISLSYLNLANIA